MTGAQRHNKAWTDAARNGDTYQTTDPAVRIGPPKFADMSSQQRSASMDATVAQVAELTKANNQLYARIVQLEREQDTLHAQHVDTVGLHERRLDVLEQRVGSLELDEVFRGSSFMARLRWMFLGR